MTYKKADEIRKEYAAKTVMGLIKSTPPHIVEAIIIAPVGSSLNTQLSIFDKVSKDWGSEERVLFDLDAYSMELEPFIVFMMDGKRTAMTLGDYLSSNISETESGKAE